MVNNYKAVICGAHSQGKTTLVNALKKRTFLASDNNFLFRVNTTRNLSELLPINEDGNSMTQYLIMARHLEFAITPGNWIIDRGALDGIAYTSYFYESGKVSREVYDAALEVYKECLKHYNRVFYIVPELELKEDGQRSTGKEFFDGVVGRFDFYIKHHTMTNLTYVMGSVDERINTVIDTIKKDLNEHK
jgi:predicted ATPase